MYSTILLLPHQKNSQQAIHGGFTSYTAHSYIRQMKRVQIDGV